MAIHLKGISEDSSIYCTNAAAATAEATTTNSIHLIDPPFSPPQFRGRGRGRGKGELERSVRFGSSYIPICTIESGSSNSITLHYTAHTPWWITLDLKSLWISFFGAELRCRPLKKKQNRTERGGEQ